MGLRDLLQRSGNETLYEHLNPAKLRVIDTCFRELGCRSFADLGGVWAVDGGYARYAADVHGGRGTIVDDDFTDAYLEHSRRLPSLTHVRANFGEPTIPDTLGDIDVAFFFDVLVHQVNPDWDQILEAYAPHCRCMAIVQPQWNGEELIRLFDLGEDAYLAAVPSDDEIYVGLFDRLDEINPRRNQPWREVHDVWQWGITDDALVERMADLGFRVHTQENTGPWLGSEHFHESAFVFARPA